MLNCTVLTSSPFQILLQIRMDVYFPGLANSRSLQDKVRKTCRSMGKFQSPDVCVTDRSKIINVSLNLAADQTKWPNRQAYYKFVKNITFINGTINYCFCFRAPEGSTSIIMHIKYAGNM
jgi:hypothetical protein